MLVMERIDGAPATQCSAMRLVVYGSRCSTKTARSRLWMCPRSRPVHDESTTRGGVQLQPGSSRHWKSRRFDLLSTRLRLIREEKSSTSNLPCSTTGQLLQRWQLIKGQFQLRRNSLRLAGNGMKTNQNSVLYGKPFQYLIVNLWALSWN